MQTSNSNHNDKILTEDNHYALSRSVLFQTVAVVDWKMDSFGRRYVDLGREPEQKCGIMKKMFLCPDVTEKEEQEVPKRASRLERNLERKGA